MNDLRLLGLGFRDVPAAQMTTRLLRITRIAFAVMAVTGVLLFYSNPVRYYHNIFFRIKVVLLVVSGINIWLFHGRIHRRVGEWQHDARPPRAARMAGLVSLLTWAGIVVAGRLVAYDWFDCDKNVQSPFVMWIQGCATSGAGE